MIEAARFNSTYLVSRDNPWPHAVRQRLDGIIGRELPAALSEEMDRLSSSRDDQSIWIFRRVHFQANLDLQRGDNELARDWAAQMVLALAQRLDEYSPSDDFMHFPSEADLLRAYVQDAAGRRQEKWYYGRFDGLKLLSATAQIRTAICRVASDGLEALAGMSANQLHKVMAALSENDARRIWDALSDLMPSAGAIETLIELKEIWNSEGRFLPDGAGEFRWALHLAVASSRGRSVEARRWPRLATSAGRLLRIFQSMSRADRALILDRLARNRTAELASVLNSSDIDAIQPLAGVPQELLESFFEQQPMAREVPERRYTPLGGVFLLLPFLDALPIPSTIHDANLFRFWILLKCFGTDRALRLFEDPLIRELLKIDPQLSCDSFCRWQAGLRIRTLRISRRLHLLCDLMRDNSRHRTPADIRYLRLPRPLAVSPRRDGWLDDSSLLILRSLAWRLPGFSTASLAHLFTNFLDLPASVEEHQDRRVVRLGSPPLQVLLNMTGICRWQYSVSWLDGKRFELYPEAP